MIRGSNLSDEVGARLVEKGLVYLDQELANTYRRSIVRLGDLVFTSWGTVGQIGIVDDSASYDEYIISNKQMKMTPDRDQVDPLFLYYYLSSPQLSDLIRSEAIGSSVPGFNLGQLKSLRICVPSLAEQRAIVDVLGALDDKIAANDAVASASEALATTLFTRATQSMEQVPMSAVLTPILGGTPARANPSFWGGSIPWISATDVTGAAHGVIVDTREKITEEAVANSKAKPLPRGSVILTARGTVGAVARLAEPAAFNQSAYGFAPGAVLPSLLYFYVLEAAKQAANFVHGSVFDTITMRTFDDLTVPDIDSVSAEAVEETLGALLTVVEHAVLENAALAATRDALLPGLMSGKLRVKDAAKAVEAHT